MNISVKGEYALHAVFDLSTQTPGQPVKIADIAKRQKGRDILLIPDKADLAFLFDTSTTARTRTNSLPPRSMPRLCDL